jgi:hypothetical protein
MQHKRRGDGGADLLVFVAGVSSQNHAEPIIENFLAPVCVSASAIPHQVAYHGKANMVKGHKAAESFV